MIFGPCAVTARMSTPWTDATRCATGVADGCFSFTGASVGAAVDGTSFVGNVSPSARIQAITLPTGTSAPSSACTPASRPSAGDSISTVTLSVSISRSGSPLRTRSPSCFSQVSKRPVV